MDNEQETVEQEAEEGGLAPADLLKSYLAFGSRAIRARRWLVVAVFCPLAALAFLVVSLWPRTYHCESRLTVQRTQVLDAQGDSPNPLRAVSDVISRRENLVNVATQVDLAKHWAMERPAALRLKDALLNLVRGQLTKEDEQSALIGYLEAKLSVMTSDTTLTIAVDWPEPQMAARIVAAAQESFMQSRHTAEISTIQEKISILDEHAVKLRQEIDTMAEQLQRIKEDRLAEVGKAAKDLEGASTSSLAPAPAPRRVARVAVEPDADLPRLKEEIEAKKRALSEVDGDRSHRLREAQAKLAELQARFTPAHPAVVLAGQAVDSLLSHEPEQAVALRGEIQALQAQLKQRSEGARSDATTVGGSGGPAAGGPQAGADLLPSKVMKLLDSGVGIDPAVNAQLQGAIGKYGFLRDQIRGARIDLDTAQAAFIHRYKVFQPPEPPSKPSKPKVPMLILASIILTLLLSVAAPILAELRSGIIVERWQVQQLRLPVLAELPFPSRSPD